ncbi:MAG: dihydrolipoamide acetyltransferase family protein [Burkholderiales bacterium]
MIEFKLPSLGADMDQGKLVEWTVKPGDHVTKGSVVAVVDTSKSAIDVEIWHDGTVWELLTQPGETVPVGAVMALLLEAGETQEQALAWKRDHAAVPVAAYATAAVLPPAATVTSAPSTPAHDSPAAPAPPTLVSPAAPAARTRVSPAARKRAAELGVDLAALAGSGPEGAITIEDVEKTGKAGSAAATTPLNRMTEIRKTIGAAMTRSKREIPHYYLATDIPLARATEWLAARNTQCSVTERVLMAAVLLKAVAHALKRHAALNGFYRDGRFEPANAVHIGVAISLRQGGLIAPALHDCDSKSLDELMRGLADLVRRARAFTLRSSELSDPTITVTNLGDGGADLVHGVIYPPQVAIIGFGGVRERSWVEEGAVRAMPVVTASLAADHRVTDGHLGALFLADLSRSLQAPDKL